MADIQSNIRVNIDTSEALANIKALQREISAFHVAMGKGGAAAAAQSAGMQQNLLNGINSSGKFAASIQTISSTTETFTRSLEKNKFSLGEYFRYAGGASKSFGKYFKTEMSTIEKVAISRVKSLQTQYIKLGRDANGALKAIAVRPLSLDMKKLGTQTAIAAQKQQLLNQLLKQGSTNLLNFGKNTQWAGRQLMVGFTIPLATLGMAATRTFKQMEEQAIKFRRVYGDTFTATSETDAMVKQVQSLANEFTKYGIAISDTMEMAANAAAAGKQGADLLAQVADATRLAVLGNVDQQKALETTISLTNAFGTATKDLRKDINFLNAVENQTVTSIDDLTTAIPKAAPVIKQLGGNVQDLAFFLTAMREGGINASEGANALKSGLASLINPTKKATTMLAGFGIDVNAIVEKDKGNVVKLVTDFASALDTLDPLSRSRAIEQMFGKFQFARMSTLFQNVIKDGSQASKVLELMGQSSAELGILAQKELKKIESSPLFKFQKAIEDFKKELAPVGEEFMKAITPLINFGTDVLKQFNKLEPGVKQFIVNFTGIVAGLGPILLMTFGLIANGVANVIKGFALIKGVFNKATSSSAVLGETTHYMTEEQLKAQAVAASLEQTHTKLTQAFTVQKTALDALTASYRKAVSAQEAYGGVPGARKAPARKAAAKKKYASGTYSVPGPKGAGDVVPAMLSPGEAVIPVRQANMHRGLITDIINGTLPGYRKGIPYVGSSTPKYVSEAQRIHQAEQQAKIDAIRKKNLAANKKKAAANKPEALFVNQSLIPKLGLTGDSPIAKHIAASSFVKKLFIGNTTGSWSEFRSSPAFSVLREAGLRENRYETVPSTNFKELMKRYKMSTYNASGALVQYFSGGDANVQAEDKKPRDSNRSRQAPTVTGAKKRAKLTEAPSSISKQKLSHTWNTKDKELKALEKALKPMLDSGQITPNQYRDAMGFHASHISKDVTTSPILGDVKNWKANNLITDNGVINKYVQALGNRKSAPHTPAQIQKIARMSGLSESVVKKELGKLMKGQHPTTASGAKVLKQVASMDTGNYQAKGAGAVLGERLKGNFYDPKAMKSRAYDPALDAKVDADVKRRIKKAEEDHLSRIETKNKADKKVESGNQTTANKRKKAEKKNVDAVEKNTAEVKKSTRATRKVFTMEERLANATERVAKARQAIADPANKKNKFNKAEIAANNLLLYGNPNGPTAEQRQSRRTEQANAKALRIQEAKDRKLAAEQRKQGGSRFGNISSGKIMGAGMLASLAGGSIGGDAGNILSTVGDVAFTGAMLKDLFSGSGKLGGKIMNSKSESAIVKGLQKALPKITEGFAKLAPKLFKFIPYVGWAVVAFEAGVEGWKLLNEEQIKQAEISQAITDTLTTTKEKLDTLNSYFGTDAKLSGAKVAGVADLGKGAGKVNLAKDFQQSEEFASTYKDTAANLKNATKEQLTRALQALGTELVGSGMGTDAAAIIIDAIQLEAGRSDIAIDPKSFTIGTVAAKETFAKSSKDILAEFTAARNAYTSQYVKDSGSWLTDSVAEVYSTADIINGTNAWQEFNMAFDLTHQKMVELATTFSSFWNGLGGQFQNGIIDAEDFNSQMDALKTQLATMPEASAIDLMDATMKKLNPDLYEFTKNISLATDKTLVLAAALRGLQIPPQILVALDSGTDVQKTDARKWLDDANKGYDAWNTKLYKLKDQLKDINSQQESLLQTEDQINKKYDKRLDLLDQIIAANEAIAKQQQGQLDMANALTEGDVAGAAKAMQQIRQDNAAYALDQQKGALEQARQNELAPIQKQETTINNYGDTLNTTINNYTDKGYTAPKVPDTVKDIVIPPKEPNFWTDPFGWIKWDASQRAAGPFGGSKNNNSTDTELLPVSPTHANGGHIRGKGTGTSDDIPAMLSNGEYVVRAKAVKAIGVAALDKMNHAEKFMNGGAINVAKYATGGLVGRYSDGGEVGSSVIDDLGSMGSTLWDIATFYPRLWADVISQNPQGLQHELFQPLQPWEQPDYNANITPVVPRKPKKKKPVMPKNGVHPVLKIPKKTIVPKPTGVTSNSTPRFANGGYASADERRASLNRKIFADDRRSSLNTKKKDSNPIANWARDNAEWAKWVPGLNGLVQATAMGDAFNSKSVNPKDAKRDALYKKGGFEGFEAGFQGMMADMGTNPFIKAIGAGISSNPYTDFAMSTLSLPVNMIGSSVNNTMKNIANTGKLFSGEMSPGDYGMSLGANLLNSVVDPFVTTYGHMADPSTDFKSGFSQAAQTVIDNKWFGTDNAEGAARARVFGGFFDVLADPTNYIPGAGIAASTAGKAGKLGAIASKISKVTSKIKPALKGIVKPGKTPSLSKLLKMKPGQQQRILSKEYAGMKLSGTDGKKYSIANIKVYNTDEFGKPTLGTAVTGSFVDENGMVVGAFHRQLFDDHIKHELLTMTTPGTGLGTSFSKKSEALYERMGVDRIDVSAGLSHGGYAWAKAGYNFKTEPTGLVDKINRYAELLPDSYELNDLAYRFSTLKLGDTGYPTPQEILGISEKLTDSSFDTLKNNTFSISELSKYIRPGDTLGRAILMGSGWSGIKFLGKDAGKKYSNFLKHNAPKPPSVSYTTKPGLNGMYDEDGTVYANGGLVKPKYFAKGGMVGHYAKGGDVIPAMLTPNEFVVSQPAVKKYGSGTMEAINNGTFGAGGTKNNIANNGTNTANSVYNNYSVNVNVSGDSGKPEDIARTVMKEISRLDAQRIRGVQ